MRSSSASLTAQFKSTSMVIVSLLIDLQFLFLFYDRHEVSTRHNSSSLALRKYVKQLLRHRNFWWFTAMNLIQVRAGDFEVLKKVNNMVRAMV